MPFLFRLCVGKKMLVELNMKTKIEIFTIQNTTLRWSTNCQNCCLKNQKTPKASVALSISSAGFVLFNSVGDSGQKNSARAKKSELWFWGVFLLLQLDEINWLRKCFFACQSGTIRSIFYYYFYFLNVNCWVLTWCLLQRSLHSSALFQFFTFQVFG